MEIPRVTRAAALALALVGCSPREEAAAPPPATSLPVARAPSAVPTPPPPVLGRAELLAAVADVASAAAAGEAYPKSAQALAGRRFALRQPFGCFGPSPDAGGAYVLDAERGILKLTVRPEAWTDTDWVRTLVAGRETEAIEGFWLRRPWIRSETCPTPPITPGAQATAETVGLVQVFDTDGSRVTRRGGRAYEATEKVGPEAAAATGGFRFVLEGRVAESTTDGPVRCHKLHPDRQPTCLVLVGVDRVAFESQGRQLAEWRN